MDRAAALRIFGLTERASEAQLQDAFWRLRAHIEERLNDASSEHQRNSCRLELKGLDQALEAAAPSPEDANRLRVSEPSQDGLSINQKRAAVILVIGLIVAGLATWWLAGEITPGERDAELPQASVAALAPELESEEPEPLPARVFIRGNLPDLHLEIVNSSTGTLAHEGVADGEAVELAAGRYEVRVEHAECRDIWTRDIALAPGGLHEYVAQICSAEGWLVVRSNVSQDRLRLDDDARGSTGPVHHLLTTGEHQVQVSKSGYLPWEGAIEVPAGATVTLRANLIPEPRETSTQKQEQLEQQAQHPPPLFSSPTSEDAGSPGDRRANSLVDSIELERTHEWHQSAKRYLLTRYDIDMSGSLDSRTEILEISCKDWRSLEGSFDQGGLQLPLSRFYGFDGTKWVDNAFGISGEMRSVAYDRLRECGLK